METVLYGLLSALCLGSADFAARVTSRAIGVGASLLTSLSIACLLISAWLLTSSERLPLAAFLDLRTIAYGAFTTLMTLMLYLGLARGPVSVVATLVAAHPVGVVLYHVASGSSLSAMQGLGIVGAITGGVITGYAAAESGPATQATRRFVTTTVSIAIIASLAYVGMVLAGQATKQAYGALPALRGGKLISLAGLLVAPVALRPRPQPGFAVPRMLPWLALQGALDAGGYFFLFKGTASVGAPVVVVLSATFGAVTCVLARVVLREAIQPLQWFGIILATLSAAALSWAGAG
jgi:drug/metabolite transporter (DMT)-like permease